MNVTSRRHQRILERTGKRYIPRPTTQPIGISLGNTAHLHEYQTHWMRHRNEPTLKRILLTLRAWFSVRPND